MAFDGIPFFDGRAPVLDSAGNPVSGAKLYFYAAGTTTPLNTFSDAARTTPNTNPVVTAANGVPLTPIYLAPDTAYRVVITDADDVNLGRDLDNYKAGGGSSAGSGGGGVAGEFASYTELKAAAAPVSHQIATVGGLRGGLFEWLTGDQSALVSADPDEGIMVPPDADTTGASGAWRRIAISHMRTSHYETALKALNGADTYRLLIPDAGVSIDRASGQLVQIPAGAVIEGDSVTATITLTNDGSGTIEYLAPQGPLAVSDLKITHSVTGSGVTAQTFKPRDDFFISNTVIDGGVTEVSGATSHVLHVFDGAANNFDRFLSLGNHYRNVGRVFLKTNTDTGSHQHLRFIGDVFQDCFTEPLALNTPSGEIRDALILGVAVQDTRNASVGLQGGGLGSASGKDIRWIGNCHMDLGEELIHGEEGLERWNAIGNTGYFTEADSGLKMLDNNVGGTRLTPSKGAVIGNVFERSAKVSNDAGFDLVDDATGEGPLHDSVLVGNVLSGWDRGMRSGEQHERNLLSNNIFRDSNTGLRMRRPTLHTRDNLIADAATQCVDLVTGGLVGPQMLHSTAAWDGTSNLITKVINPAAFEGGMMGWTVEKDGFTTAAGSNDYRIMPIGEMMDGDLYVAWVQGSIYRFQRFSPTWDGTTFTANAGPVPHGAGAVALVDVREDGSGNLAVRLNNTTGGALSDSRIQLMFIGIHVWS